MTEKKATVKKTATKKVATAKTATTKKTTAKKAEVVVDVNVVEIAKAASISNEEVYLGIGWLLKEGKIKAEENLLTLA